MDVRGELVEPRTGERGVALVTAIGFAVIVFVTAMVVLNQTFRRFQLSAHRSDHSIGQSAAEAGLQYAFARLEKEGIGPTSLQQRVINKAPAEFIITSDPNVNPKDELRPELRVGQKHVTIRILHQSNPPDPGRPFRVKAQSTYGTNLP